MRGLMVATVSQGDVSGDQRAEWFRRPRLPDEFHNLRPALPRGGGARRGADLPGSGRLPQGPSHHLIPLSLYTNPLSTARCRDCNRHVNE